MACREPDSGQGPSGLLKIHPFAAGRDEVRLTNGEVWTGIVLGVQAWVGEEAGRHLLFVPLNPALPYSRRTEIRTAECTPQTHPFMFIFNHTSET